MKQRDIFIFLAEDICPNLGCYGDVNARTPNLDAFAKENIKFNYCSSAAPVCSAARTSLNIGMYGPAAGVGQHRSFKPLPEGIKNIGGYMQDAGYFTCIGKTDFNFSNEGGYDLDVHSTRTDSTAFSEEIRDVVRTHNEKPMFMLHSLLCTHQSQYGFTQDHEEHRSSMPRLKPEEYAVREDIKVPGYHFDSYEAREIWGQYHEKMTTMDRLFGEAMAVLKEEGKYDDALIIFAGDNGHGIPMGKCDLWNEGVHVPMMMHVPTDVAHQFDVKTDEHGPYTDYLACFVDFATTSLSLAGAKIPSHLQGRILVGDDCAPAPDCMYSFSQRVDEVFENSRCIRTVDKLYACDLAYSPTRRLNMYQTTTSPWFNASMKEKAEKFGVDDQERRAFFRGIPRVREQLFDMVNDPNQLHNLAPERKEETATMRKELLRQLVALHDDALMPEPIAHQLYLKTGLTPFEILRDETLYPVAELADMWSNMLDGVCDLTTHKDPSARMMLINWFQQNGEMDKIQPFLADENEVVRAFAAYWLHKIDMVCEICLKTDNLVLLMYIADLIATLPREEAIPCLDAICENCALTNDYPGMERYMTPTSTALQMLSHRLGHPLPASKWMETSSARVAKILDVTLMPE